MGFSANAGKRACIATGRESSAEIAMHWLLEHIDDADINDPPPPAAGRVTEATAVDSSGGGGGGSGSSGGGAASGGSASLGSVASGVEVDDGDEAAAATGIRGSAAGIRGSAADEDGAVADPPSSSAGQQSSTTAVELAWTTPVVLASAPVGSVELLSVFSNFRLHDLSPLPRVVRGQ
jgi:hypothetical protein